MTTINDKRAETCEVCEAVVVILDFNVPEDYNVEQVPFQPKTEEITYRGKKTKIEYLVWVCPHCGANNKLRFEEYDNEE